MTDDNNPSLKRFCLVLEKVLRHGIKGTPMSRVIKWLTSSQDHTTLFAKKDYWNYCSTLSGVYPSAADCLKNVSELQHVKSVLGRGRAFVYYALMVFSATEKLQVLT